MEKPASPLEDKKAKVSSLSGSTHIVGEISNCSKIEISGYLEGNIVAREVIVREGGCLKGTSSQSKQRYTERSKERCGCKTS